MSRRYKIGGEASAVATRHERDAVGSSNDGQKLGKELSLEQALRQRHLPGTVRMHRSLERVRLHVSVQFYDFDNVAHESKLPFNIRIF